MMKFLTKFLTIFLMNVLTNFLTNFLMNSLMNFLTNFLTIYVDGGRLQIGPDLLGEFNECVMIFKHDLESF